jgi:hypothetical protein
VGRPYVHFSESGKPFNQSLLKVAEQTVWNMHQHMEMLAGMVAMDFTGPHEGRREPMQSGVYSELIPYSRKQLAALDGRQLVASNRPERNKHIQRQAEPARMEPAVDELVESLSVQTRRFATIVPHVHSLSRSPDLSLNSTLLNCLRRKTICSRVLSRINLLNGMQEMVRRAACEILRFW